MVNRERLKKEALRAYEIGRLRRAVRASSVLVPATVVCAFGTGAGERCACLGVLLLTVAVFLRWRDRRGADNVRNGLLAGALPMITGLAVGRFAPGCAGAPLFSACTAVCLCFGVLAGVWLGLRTARGTAGPPSWLAAAGVSILVASLGCVGLGIAGIVGAAVGLVVGTASGAAAVRAPA
jgi:hypothetical protein